MRYCIYKTTNQINGKFYIGVHDLDRIGNYLGSGKKLLQAIKKYGRENFKREILNKFELKNEAFEAEAKIVTHDLVKDRMCYNVALGGQGGSIRKGMKNSKLHNDKIQAALFGNNNGRGHRSEEFKQKISNARKGMRFSDEHRRNLSLSHLGNKSALKKEISVVVSI